MGVCLCQEEGHVQRWNGEKHVKSVRIVDFLSVSKGKYKLLLTANSSDRMVEVAPRKELERDTQTHSNIN